MKARCRENHLRLSLNGLFPVEYPAQTIFEPDSGDLLLRFRVEPETAENNARSAADKKSRRKRLAQGRAYGVFRLTLVWWRVRNMGPVDAGAGKADRFNKPNGSFSPIGSISSRLGSDYAANANPWVHACTTSKP